jgi:hypothetical protein
MKKLTPEVVRGALLERGFKSLSDWARQNGYSQQHVSSVIHRWCGRTDGMPKNKAYHIVRKLSATIGKQIVESVKF